LRLRGILIDAAPFPGFKIAQQQLFISVMIGADTNTHTRSLKADAAAPPLVIIPASDMALARRVSVGLTGLADDDAALTVFTPAMAILIADHANVLNIADRSDGDVGDKRCSGRRGGEERACADRQRDRDIVHNISPKVIVSVSQ
jgi:hypothetical protein